MLRVQELALRLSVSDDTPLGRFARHGTLSEDALHEVRFLYLRAEHLETRADLEEVGHWLAGALYIDGLRMELAARNA